MKKIILLLFTVTVLFTFLIFTADAENEKYDEEYFSDSFFSSLDKDTRETLTDFGIDSLDTEKIFSVSFKQITEYFSDDFSSTVKKCFSDLTLFICLITVSGLINSFFIDNKKQNIITICSVVVTTLILITKINPIINMLLTTMKMNGSFILAFIPIFTLIVSISGTPVSAITYNSVTLAISEAISYFINNFAVDLIGAFICISISFSINRLMNINRLINLINRAVNIIIGFISGGFASLLSIKGIMSASVDTVSSKSIRFVLSSMIPVVGSSISDAYSSLIGSINLIKSSLAAIAILVVIIISLPSILEAVFYCLSFTVLSYISEIFECEQLSGVFRAFCSAVRILLLLCILEIFILLISTGIMLSLKGVI